MTIFNGQELRGAENVNNVSTEVGIVFIRKSGSDGEYIEVPSTSNVNITFDNTGAVDIRSESRGTAKKVTQNKANITFDLTENAGVSFISELYGIDKTSAIAGAKDITDRPMAFDLGVIEFKEISNDDAGVTSIVVKSTDGATTYELDTDYSIDLVGNITRLKVITTGSLTDTSAVLVSGIVNLNAQDASKFVANYVGLEQFDIRVAVEVIESGIAKYRLRELNPVTLNSTYVLPFLNAVTAGGAQNTSLQFDLDEEGTVNMVDELL